MIKETIFRADTDIEVKCYYRVFSSASGTLELYTCINTDFLIKLINSIQTEGCAVSPIMAKDVVKKLNERYDVHFGDVIVFNFDDYEEISKMTEEWYENI